MKAILAVFFVLACFFATGSSETADVTSERFLAEHATYERCVELKCLPLYRNRSLADAEFSTCVLECSQRAIETHLVYREKDAPLVTCYRRGQPCTTNTQCSNGDDGYYKCQFPPNCPFCTSQVCSLGGTSTHVNGVCPMQGYLCLNPANPYYPAYNCGQATDNYKSCATLTFNVGSAPGSVCVNCLSCA